MSNFCIDMMSLASSRPPLPPREVRTLAQRLQASDAEWHEVINTALGHFARRGTVSGASLFLGLSRFAHELIDDTELCGRLVQHFEIRLRDEFPAEQGRLL
jgi:hypothetical protein